MSQFSYSFCLSLFHSLWQSALLYVLYLAIQPIVKKQLPAFKRNILYALLFSQVIISVFTFFIYYTNTSNFYRDIIETNFSALLIKEPLLEKYASWITTIYTLVISFKTVQLLYNWHRFKQLCNTTLVKPTVDLKLFTLKKVHEFGIHRKVTLWFSEAVSTPLTFGFLKPVILMPVALLNHLSIQDAESLIIHELTHIKNNDYILNWILVISETLFFFNPFIRIISNKIKLEREKNCDVQVLQFRYPVINYAETLLKTAKFKTNINFFPLAAVFKNKQLLQRIKFFTVDNNLVFNKRKYGTVSFSAIAITVLMNLFILVQIKNHKTTIVSDTITPMMTLQPAFKTSSAPTPEASETFSAQASGLTKTLDEKAAALHLELKKVNTDAKAISEEALRMANEELQASYAIPVVNVEPEEQDVEVKEESSGTNESVTKSYKLKLKNGQWKNELVLVIKEGKPKLDSICVVKDSIVSFIPAMQ